MSETKSGVVDTKSRVFVSSDKAKSKRAAIKPLLITAFIAIVLCIIAINGQPTKKSPLDGLSASNRALSGDYIGAQKMLNAATKSGTPAQRAGTYLEKAYIAIESTKYQDALTFANKAETISPSVNSAAMIAVVQTKLGNNKSAIDAYKLTISRFKNPNIFEQQDIDSYKAAIVNLGNKL